MRERVGHVLKVGRVLELETASDESVDLFEDKCAYIIRIHLRKRGW